MGALSVAAAMMAVAAAPVPTLMSVPAAMVPNVRAASATSAASASSPDEQPILVVGCDARPEHAR
jgi:hypothetical protein